MINRSGKDFRRGLLPFLAIGILFVIFLSSCGQPEPVGKQFGEQRTLLGLTLGMSGDAVRKQYGKPQSTNTGKLAGWDFYTRDGLRIDVGYWDETVVQIFVEIPESSNEGLRSAGIPFSEMTQPNEIVKAFGPDVRIRTNVLPDTDEYLFARDSIHVQIAARFKKDGPKVWKLVWLGIRDLSSWPRVEGFETVGSP
jgi:hypothetical protein